jgi:glycosyltransferase involved in cell wall biosynthesis
MTTDFTLKPGLSVLICCYNSATRLPKTLQALARQQPVSNGIGVEVLVIDNGSKDDTAAIAAAMLTTPDFPHEGRVLSAPEPGKSRALKLGLAQARYEYVVIVDDDNALAPDYLSLAWDIMESDPQIAALGGEGEPVTEQTPPDWFARYAADYAAAPQAVRSGDVTHTNQYVYGAGMVLRSSAWREVYNEGFESLLTEIRGNKPSGEDNEMCYALILGGYKIWYDSRLRFQHFIPAERLTWQYLHNTHRVNATSHAELQPWLHFLRLPAASPLKIPRLAWLRNGLYTLKFILPSFGRAVSQGKLGQAENSDSLRVFYYWRAFKEYVRKGFSNDRSYYKVRDYITRLRHRSNGRIKTTVEFG